MNPLPQGTRILPMNLRMDSLVTNDLRMQRLQGLNAGISIRGNLTRIGKDPLSIEH